MRGKEGAAGGGGVGTRPWWLALLACGGAYWPLALEPSAMTSRHPYYCGHPPAWVGIQNATSAAGGGVTPPVWDDSLLCPNRFYPPPPARIVL